MSTSTLDHLPRTSPERQGISSPVVLQFVEELERNIHEIHSFMLLRHGSVVVEGWWSPYGPDDPHAMFSVSKSFTSAAVRLAMEEGRFSLDDLVLSFFPEETPLDVSASLTAITVRHLLTMSTGHTADSLPYLVARSDGNWIKGFFEAPILHPPGSHFAYDTGATYMLSAIVQKATGLKLIDYLQPRLFEAIGIKNASWQESPQGITIGGYGLSMKTEDLARFGQLYLQKGRWGDRQILPETWVEASVASQISNGNGSLQNDSTQGYGYQFWRCRHNAYRASGVFGQYCIVLPEQDAVIALTGGMDVFDDQQVLDLIWDRLLPAMRPEQLPDDARADDELKNKLANLNLFPVRGANSSARSSEISGQTYRVDSNALKIETISLWFGGSGYRIRIQTASGEETIACSYGTWQRGQTALFNDPRWFSNKPVPIAASGAWTAEDRFTMVVRLYETPFVHTLVYCFAGAEMMVEMQVNVSLDVSKPLLLMAYL